VSTSLDHVVLAVADLAAAADELETRHGLASVAGGRHPGWGTENAIVPLGDTYLELIAVADEAEAAASALGRWVRDGSGGGPRPLGWAVRTDDLDAVAERLGLAVRGGSRITVEGEELHWRYAGIERAMDEACLPFFIRWAEGAPFPGRAGSPQLRLRELRLTGDPTRLAAWLGPNDLPVVIGPGRPAVAGIVLDGSGRTVVLSGDGT
jgi:glyoxalase-like protein